MNHPQATYRTQQAWRDIQSFLPSEHHLGPDQEPHEEWWDWHGHRIHLDRFRNPGAPARVILFHGVGTNGRQMSTILGAPLFRSGFETVATDMPGYGMTVVAPGVTVAYDDWVEAGNAFVDAELARDPRPIVLYGLSAGGMQTYHVAALNRKVKGIVGMIRKGPLDAAAPQRDLSRTREEGADQDRDARQRRPLSHRTARPEADARRHRGLRQRLHRRKVIQRNRAVDDGGWSRDRRARGHPRPGRSPRRRGAQCADAD